MLKSTPQRKPHLTLIERIQAPRDGAQDLSVSEAGPAAFQDIVRRVGQAQERIEIRAFVWRDDESGNQMALALLQAADRGVQVSIRKDRVAATYEYLGGNKQSFFHKKPHPTQWAQAQFLRVAYGVPGSFRQNHNALAQRLVEHTNVTVSCDRRSYDHAKLFTFDDSSMVLGSMGIGDNHQHEWVDTMVGIQGIEHVNRLRQRIAGEVAFDASRRVDFLVHNRSQTRGTCPMLNQRLAFVDSAQKSITAEMAYLGDKRFTAALLSAVKRGVYVTLHTSAKADMLGDLNLKTCDTLLRKSGAPSNLTIALLPGMVHSKTVVVDGCITDVGSANFTPLSHGVYDEINMYVNDVDFARTMEDVILRRIESSHVARDRVPHSRVNYLIERAIVAYQSRHSA